MRGRNRAVCSLMLSLIASLALTGVPLQTACAQNPAPTANAPQKISVETFRQRRRLLMDSLKEGTAVLNSRGEETGTGYRADGNFWYLTGIDEPGAILVLAPNEAEKEILLLPPRDVEAERWTGAHPALTESLQIALGFDHISRTDALGGLLVAHMKRTPVLHLISTLLAPNEEEGPDLALYGRVSARIPGVSIRNSSRLLESMRMTKSPAEIAAIEKAIAITHQGITDALAELHPGITEFQLDGVLDESFKRRGAQHMAFDPIIGAGEETTVLHYQKRDRVVQAGELVLLDVGAEWDHYCADVTRTFPVDGTFSPEQAKIYDIVYAAQNAAIAACKPGVTVRAVHEAAKDVIRKAGYVDEFIHGTSHDLGLEVHDVADYNQPLRPGMVITIEPGIYLAGKQLGVRIEDDVLVTRDGCRILTAQIPRERTAVEAWLAAARR